MPQATTEPAAEPARLSQLDTCPIAPEAAASAVAASAPSILDLGRQLAAVQTAYLAHDIVALKGGAKACDARGLFAAERRAEAAREVLDQRAKALRDLIATMPARSLQDAAVQVGLIVTAADSLYSSDAAPQVVDAAGSIVRMALGILPIVANAADLDMEAMGWRENEGLRVHRFAAVGVTS